VASQSKQRRNWGFWWLILSNFRWVVWGWHDHAYALIVLQICLVVLNIRGAKKTIQKTVLGWMLDLTWGGPKSLGQGAKI
jgi:hypothetical protein